MDNICLVKDICSNTSVVWGNVLEEQGNLILVDILYTTDGPDVRVYDIFGGSEIVQSKQIMRRKLWFRREDVIFPS